MPEDIAKSTCRCVEIKFINDKTFLDELNNAYAEILAQKNQPMMITIDMSDIYKWVSANSLVNLLTFIAQITNRVENIAVKIFLFSKHDAVMCFENTRPPNRIFFDKFTAKLRFYHSWGFYQEIYKFEQVLNDKSRKLECYPSEYLITEWIVLLKDLIPTEYRGYSSNLMPLSTIQAEESISSHKKSLDKRIQNLTYVLWTHMYGRKRSPNIQDLRKAEETSANIMYELVKNIYQHSGKRINNGYGYATVQIMRQSILLARNNLSYPNSDHVPKLDKFDKALLLGMEDVEPSRANDVIRYLAITVADYGAGIPDTVRRFGGNEATTVSSLEIIRKAIFSNLTTKSDFLEQEGQIAEFYYREDNKIRLSPRGYGWIYCAIFIAKTLGSFNVTSGDISVTYVTTVDGFNAMTKLRDAENPLEEAEKLLKKPENVFSEIAHRNKEPIIPGTRLFIEIPINYRWIGKTEQFLEHKRKTIDKTIERIFDG